MDIAKACRTAGAVAAACGAVLCAPAPAADDGPRLRNLERELNRAIAQRDARRVDEMLSDDWVLITGTGRMKSKQDVLAEIALPDLEFQDNDTRDVMVRVWGDTAVVTALLWIKGTGSDKPFERKLWFSDTYVRTPKGWRYVLGQASLPLP